MAPEPCPRESESDVGNCTLQKSASSAWSVSFMTVPMLLAQTQACAGVEELRGTGAATTKSVWWFPWSRQPSSARSTAVELDGAGAWDAPQSAVAAPKATRSMMPVAVAQMEKLFSAAEWLTNATLPPDAVMLIGPVQSGLGTGTP